MDTETYRQWPEQWQLDKILPARIGDFIRRPVTEQDEERRLFFQYEEPDRQWRIEGFFQEETQDFVVKYDIGVAIWTELHFLLGDGKTFGEALAAEFVSQVTRRFVEPERHLPRAVADLRLDTYEWGDVLPETYGILRRKIGPAVPIEGLNGSYVVGLYADEANEYGVLLFYNTFRDEFFAETCHRRVPGMIHDLDAVGVEAWREVLTAELTGVMDRLLAL